VVSPKEGGEARQKLLKSVTIAIGHRKIPDLTREFISAGGKNPRGDRIIQKRNALNRWPGRKRVRSRLRHKAKDVVNGDIIIT